MTRDSAQRRHYINVIDVKPWSSSTTFHRAAAYLPLSSSVVPPFRLLFLKPRATSPIVSIASIVSIISSEGRRPIAGHPETRDIDLSSLILRHLDLRLDLITVWL